MPKLDDHNYYSYQNGRGILVINNWVVPEIWKKNKKNEKE